METKQIIGSPSRIYDFAVASKIIAIKDDAFVAWIWEKNVKIENQTRSSDTAVVLSRWTPGPNPVRHFAIRQTTGYNIALSIGEIDGKVLVAWHEFGKIRHAVVDLNKQKFEETLKTPKREAFEVDFSDWDTK